MKYIVYITVNSVNNKVYVGVHKTATPNLFDGYLGCGTRINSYKSKNNHPFQKAVNKYGPNKFSRHTLFICDSDTEAYKIESEIVNIEWIKSGKNYNIALGGGSGKGTHSMKTIYCYSKDGKFIESYDSIEDACNDTGASRGSIRHVLNGSSNTASDLRWSFDKHQILPGSGINTNTTKVYKYDRSGKYVKSYESIADACEDTGANKTGISLCISNDRTQCGGFLWSDNYYIDGLKKSLKKDIPVTQYSQDGVFIADHKSAKEASKKLGKSIGGNITACCKGKRNTAGGFLWEYK